MAQRIAVLFDNFGPYHVARLNACARVMDLLAIECSAVSSEYEWTPANSTHFQRVTLVDQASAGSLTATRARLQKALSSFRPASIAVPGWSSWLALNAMQWASSEKVRIIVMSDSQASDSRRFPWKEVIKKRLLRLCHAALAGGRPHREYLLRLGMQPDAIYEGYDVVDNRFFSEKSAAIRAQADQWRTALDLPARYFLCSARFLPKKNLIGLLGAYQLFVKKSAAKGSNGAAWQLVLLGDGELSPEITATIHRLGLRDLVQLPGFRQINELPAYYAMAGAFILPSTTEQWGLVVNEAMASGLPVLVSERCGCAPDLVVDGRNGFTFDPLDLTELAKLMLRLSAMTDQERQAMGRAGQEIIAHWSPETFAESLGRAADFAMSVPPRRVDRLGGLLLSVLSRR